MTKTYTAFHGFEVGGGNKVFVGDDTKSYALPPRHDLRNHSPDGFAWGYGGSGPAQLSLALLADALGDDARALRLYQHFKASWTAKQPAVKGWIIMQETIRDWADQFEGR